MQTRPLLVSAALLRHIDDYRVTLEAHSGPILPPIEWESTDRGSVRVLNDRATFHRFFDATPHAEFLFRCVRETIGQDLRQETSLLQAYDSLSARVQEIVYMPRALPPAPALGLAGAGRA